MLQNSQIIHRLSVEERIRFVLGDTVLASSKIGDYQFPIISLKANPVVQNNNKKTTIFPSYQSLGYSWNLDLIEKINQKRGFEANILCENTLFKQSVNLFGKTSVSEDPFLAGAILNAAAKGLKESNSFISLDTLVEEKNKMINKELSSMPSQMLLKNNAYDVLVVDDVEEMRQIRQKYSYSGLFFARAHSDLDIVRFLNAGATYISSPEEYENSVEYLKEALRRYKNEKAKLDNKMISESEYLDMLTDGKILSLENLNLACDRLINLMMALDELHANSNSKVATTVVSQEKEELFDVEAHDSDAYLCAKESIVLLKNEGILPLNRREDCAIIGDAFKNPIYYQESFGARATKFDVPYETASEHVEIRCKAFATGYADTEENKEELLEAAVALASECKTSIIYLYSNGEDYLPQNQLDVIKAVYETGSKIVAVIQGDNLVDLSFRDMCSAIILAKSLGQGGTRAILDVIVGLYNPSGRLTHSYPLLIADSHATEGLPMYLMDTESVLYPFGYGLSYTSFDYHHLEINEAGVSVSVTNVGEYAGEEVVQLYVQKESSTRTLDYKVLRGFTKVLLLPNETKKVFIPFDEYTFRYFNEKKQGYGVEGGVYNVYLSDNCESIKIKGKITLKPYIEPNRAYENETEKLLSEKELTQFIANKPKIRGIKGKLFLNTILFIYVSLLCGYIAYLSYTTNMLGAILIGAIGVVLDLILIVKRSKMKKAYKKEKAEHLSNKDMNETLTLMLEKMEDIPASNRVVYEIEELVPIEEDEDEDEIDELDDELDDEFDEEGEDEFDDEDEAIEEEVVEEVVEEIVDLESTVLTMEEIAEYEAEEIRLMEEQQASKDVEEGFKAYEKVVEFNTESSLSQVVSNFMAYAEYKGITMDINSVRSLIAGLSSSHILVLTTRLKELFPAFVEILNDFLGNNSHVVTANDTWISSFNLVWKKEEDGTYNKTDFVNDVYNANRLKQNINVAILDEVSMKNVDSYLKEFIDFANSPSYNHSMRLNQNMALKIPTNFKLILIPKEDDFLETMSKELADASVVIELLMRKSEQTSVEEVKPNSLSHTYLEDLVYEAKKEEFLEEETWKKLEYVLAEIKEPALLDLNNKVVLQIERYTSVYISAGGDELDAFDSVFAEKIIPLIKTLPNFKENKGSKYLLDVVTKHFGQDHINRVARVLNAAVHE